MDIHISSKEIIFNKELTALDQFVIDFIKIIEKHTDCVIVSGYVSILFGRSRATEDVDALILPISKEKFEKLHKDFISNGFWFLNSENTTELFDLLTTKHSIRVAYKHQAVPNIEIKFIKSEIEKDASANKVKAIISGKTIYISPIELQIAYKEVILASKKDKEDALHLRETFKQQLNKNLLEKYINTLRVMKKHG
ncbi:MAG: hypothetical protein AABX75_00980, partial [Nanoarchaeota archaeon]